jgi:cytochrome c oxidase cbb3-type subunit 3
MKTLSNYTTKSSANFKALMAMLVSPLALGAQNSAPVAEPNPVYTNPVFLVMVVTAIVLLLVIVSLTATMKNLSANKKESSTGGKVGAILLTLGLGSSLPASAENAMPPITIGGLDSWIFVMLGLVILAEFMIILVIIGSVKNLLIGLGFQKEPDPTLSKPWISWKWLDRQLTDAVPLEREAEVMTDHDYDGIKELDNNLPPWWVYGFYFTIIFSVIYVFNYHIFRTSPLPAQEYQQQLAEAEVLKKERLATVSAAVDESNVTMLSDAGMLASGKDIYTGNCANCHGQAGEGGVGPNLTDKFWLHGGGIQNVFKTIKYGVPAKGMIAWQSQLKPEAIQKVASYVLSLQGTNPANAKEAQGPEWTETNNPAAAASDSSATVASDTLSSAMAQQ